LCGVVYVYIVCGRVEMATMRLERQKDTGVHNRILSGTLGH
jgi:hypothetical protein